MKKGWRKKDEEKMKKGWWWWKDSHLKGGENPVVEGLPTRNSRSWTSSFVSICQPFLDLIWRAFLYLSCSEKGENDEKRKGIECNEWCCVKREKRKEKRREKRNGECESKKGLRLFLPHFFFFFFFFAALSLLSFPPFQAKGEARSFRNNRDTTLPDEWIEECTLL